MSHELDDADRNAFAEEMRAQRKNRGWSADELAAKMLYSVSTVKNLESGYRAPTPAQAIAADEAFGTPGTFQRLERRLRGIPFSAGFRPFTPYEEQARLIRTFQNSLVPGLFQTRKYANAILAVNPETTEDIVKDMLEARLQRQQILYRQGTPPPPRIHAILDEHVLHRGIIPPAGMAEQLQHLVRLARMPRISIQVFPGNRAHPGHGGFIIAETPQHPAIVYIDGVLDGRVVESADTAERMDVVFRALQMEAYSGTVSLAKLEEAAQQWNDQTEP